MFVGIDVSKDQLDVHLRPPRPSRSRATARVSSSSWRVVAAGPELVVPRRPAASRSPSRPRSPPPACRSRSSIRPRSAFRPRHRPPRQDRSAGCRADRALRRAGPPRAAAGAR